MPASATRPDIADLALNSFGRSVHPELLALRRQTILTQDAYRVSLALCDAGHFITFRTDTQTITEILTCADTGLPQKKRLFARKLQGNRTDSRVFPGGLRYQVCSQAETLDGAIFARLTEELSLDCLNAAVAFRFPPGSRMAPAPLSLISADIQPDGLLLHIFHTFPESHSIVRTQSLFEL